MCKNPIHTALTLKCPLQKTEKHSTIQQTCQRLFLEKTKKTSVQDAKDMFPVIDVDTNMQSPKEKSIPINFYLQNVHTLLAMYKPDIKTKHMSYDGICKLVSDGNGHDLLQFLTYIGLLNTNQQCENR